MALMSTTLRCVDARAEGDTDPRTDAETEGYTAASPAEQPNDQSDARTNRDAESCPAT
jgi:hypothetical protein